jgi:hypothetical protein
MPHARHTTQSLLLAAGLAACAGGAPADGPAAAWVGRVDTLADTLTVTTIRGTVLERPPIIATSVSALWGADSLARPVGMVEWAGNLAIAERDRIFVISPDGELRAVLGRKGGGPGEFEFLAALTTSDGRLVAYDASTARLTTYRNLADPPETAILAPSRQLLNLRGPSIAIVGDHLFAAGQPNVTPGEPFPTTIVRQSLLTGQADSLASVRGPTYQILADGLLGPQTVFTPSPITTFAPGGAVAMGDGVAYCILILQPGQSGVRRICREWAPIPVTDAVRSPNLEATPGFTELPEETREFVQRVVRQVPPGTHRNSIDRLVWGAAGQLWVRVVDSAQADLHPYVVSRLPDLRPPVAHWDVFDAEGRHLAEVRLPTVFEPQAFIGDRVYGLLELETGERALGMVVVPLDG